MDSRTAKSLLSWLKVTSITNSSCDPVRLVARLYRVGPVGIASPPRLFVQGKHGEDNLDPTSADIVRLSLK